MNKMTDEISVKDIKLPFKHCDAPAINWGGDFNELEDLQKIVYLKKFGSSMNHATMLIQAERNILANENEVMRRMLDSSQTAITNQKAMLIKTITDNNATQQMLGEEITKLRTQLRILSE
jgi:hypothetical protein